MPDLAAHDPYIALYKKTLDKHIPFTCLFELTYTCNVRCIHCYNTKKRQPELSLDEIAGILEQLRAAGVLFIAFTGGEVFTRGDFIDIVAAAREKGFVVRVKTNGTLVDEEKARALHKLAVQMVDLSFLGATPQTHDAITQVAGSFARTLRGLRLLRALGVRVTVNYPVMVQNYREIQQAKELAEALGCRFRYDPTITPTDDLDMAPTTCRLADEELELVLSARTGRGPWKERERGAQERFCATGRNTCCIDPWGNVYPCVELRLWCGNLRQQDFLTVWNTSPVLRRLRGLTIADAKECSACPLLGYCFRCSGLALKEQGDLLAPSTEACRQAVVRNKLATGEAPPLPPGLPLRLRKGLRLQDRQAAAP